MNANNNSLNPWLIPVTLGASGIAGFIAGKLLVTAKYLLIGS